MTSLKVCLVNENFKGLVVKKFQVSKLETYTFADLTDKIFQIFPELKEKSFTIYWKDEENDEVVISSDDELLVAFKEMKIVKKFFVMPVISKSQTETDNIHPNIYCDGCDSNVVGYRYKCLICKDYDLCMECEQAGIHSEHPMLRATKNFPFNRIDKTKLMRYFSCFVPLECESKDSRNIRRQSHNRSDSHKKRRRDKHDSGPETGEESDESRRKKHSHKRCVYSHLMSDFFKNMDPSQFYKEETFKTDSQEETNEKVKEEPIHVKNLKSMVKTIASLLNHLGVDVDFEVRSSGDAEENEKNQTQKTQKKEEAETPAAPTETPTPSAPSAPSPVKEVRFASPEQNLGTMKQKVEEITKILANQTINQSTENDGWVSFEELKKDSEEPQASTSDEGIPNTLNSDELSQAEKKTKETICIYPTLRNEKHMPTNPVVRNALESMLAMGFTNEGGWLTHLLEAKNGDINLALESLAPHKK